ncbi:hypothetical protein [Leptospira levettii]|uniref:Virulence-protein E N-terminal domain-containing protein n=1 Tax=Leptospira levettii TaxID=2023178 RepID=A0AAW5V9H4_9LEPT|nr:hypothetical protein [Leptospira levettii]MCW7512121.1 hypothetical protein [Leptospira levettii]MCW7517140.1 hypothetical protein [Leptospira levettii]
MESNFRKYTSFEKECIKYNAINEKNFIETVESISKSKSKSNSFILSKKFNQKIIFPQLTKVLGFCTDRKGGYLNKRINLPNQKYSTFTVNDNQILFKLILGHYQACRQKPTYNPDLIENKKWEELKGLNLNAKTRNNISLRENFNSNILCIDIDTHDLDKHDIYKDRRIVYKEDYYKYLINFLYEKLGVHPVLCQTSKLHRGIYLYYKTNVIRKKEKEELFKIIYKLIHEFDKPYHENKPGKKETIEYKNITGIELRTPDHLNRLPLTYDYDVKDNKLETITSFAKTLKHIASNLASNILYYEAIYQEHQPEVSDEEIKRILVSSYTEEEKISSTVWHRNKVTKLNCEKIHVPIEGGNKNKGLFRLACLFLYSNKSHDTQAFHNLVYSNNQSSQDVADWFDLEFTRQANGNLEDKEISEIDWIPSIYGEKALDGILKGAEDFLNSNQCKPKRSRVEVEEVYNEVVLNSDEKKKCELIISSLKNSFCKKYPHSYLKNTVYEIVCKMKYEELNSRSIDKKTKFKKQTKENLRLGGQFPRNYQDLVKKKYNMKCDVYKMFNLILKSKLFNQIFSTKKGYLYGILGGSCRQFTFNSDTLEHILRIGECISSSYNKEEYTQRVEKSIPQYFILCDSQSSESDQGRVDIPPLIGNS